MRYEIFIFTIKSTSFSAKMYTKPNKTKQNKTEHISIYIFKCLSKMPECISNAWLHEMKK